MSIVMCSINEAHEEASAQPACLQYYADDPPQGDPEDFDVNRAALGLRTRVKKVLLTCTLCCATLHYCAQDKAQLDCFAAQLS